LIEINRAFEGFLFEIRALFYLYVDSGNSHRVVLSFEWEQGIVLQFEGELASSHKKSIDSFFLDSYMTYHAIHCLSAHCILDKSRPNGADSLHLRTDGS
jgi:hypothetical protein